ncbi:hypothetical protein HMPREF9719_01433 [Corynebacterium otitidis ATCC 51513]|uniref:Membrane transport protein MMPL domain-containing protein n=3 Tax=Corynebacterium otitidis TaxID=29321 RepID=K0YDP2_9CORY|nr:MMPL family transporter [Corynebacterium otitidis]EJZ81612.1 hypothetical protein HMPREF9719_01433 [Corynebacterium otitidis ATCC 51513]
MMDLWGETSHRNRWLIVPILVALVALLFFCFGRGHALSPLPAAAVITLAALAGLIVLGSAAAALVPAAAGVLGAGTAAGVLGATRSANSPDNLDDMLAGVLGLGLAAGFATVIAARFRLDIGRGTPPARAVATATASSGTTVLLAGAAVALSAVGLAIVPEDAVRSTAFGALVGAASAVAVAVLVVPALLALLGERIDAGAISRAPLGHIRLRSSVWWRLPAWAMRQPWIAATGGVVVVLLAAVPAVALPPATPLPERIPLLGLFLLVASYLPLCLALGSMVLPIKAVVLAALGAEATVGLVALAPTTPTASTLVVLTVTAFGLLLAGDVITLHRIRKAHAAGADTDGAILTGTARSAPLAAALELVLAAAAIAWALSPDSGSTTLGLGLAAAMLVDSLALRPVLGPAAMFLLRSDNWWAPAWLRATYRALRAVVTSGRAARRIAPGRPEAGPRVAPRRSADEPVEQASLRPLEEATRRGRAATDGSGLVRATELAARYAPRPEPAQAPPRRPRSHRRRRR